MIPTTLLPTNCLTFRMNTFDVNYHRQVTDLQARCSYLESENARLKQMIFELTENQNKSKTPEVESKRK
jgi:hypothetical protein